MTWFLNVSLVHRAGAVENCWQWGRLLARGLGAVLWEYGAGPAAHSWQKQDTQTLVTSFFPSGVIDKEV